MAGIIEHLVQIEMAEVMSENFFLLPAVDVAGGKSVRLSQGSNQTETLETSPLEVIQEFSRAGTSWIHLVDIDQAFGRGENQTLLAEAISTNPQIRFEISGGIKDQSSLDSALVSGAEWINLSSAALANPNWLTEVIAIHGAKLSFGLDVKDNQVIARGTSTVQGELPSVIDFLKSIGCQRFVVTDVMRDGMLLGPNIELLSFVASSTGKPVIASGGIANIADLVTLKEMPGVIAAILGKALYAGNFTIVEALEAIR